MFKKFFPKSILLLSILTVAIFITGCSLEKDMTASNEKKPLVSSEQQLNESDEKSEDVDDTESGEEEQLETDSTEKGNSEGQTSSRSGEKKEEPSASKGYEKNPTVTTKKTVTEQSSVQSTKSPSASVKPTKKPTEKAKEPNKKNTVVYSIVISSNEVPLQPTEMEITDGETVLNVLIRITKEKKIQMDYRGGQGATAYVEGIDNVYEFDRGQGSGWMYRVNGIFPDRGAGVVPLYAGDRVEWLYTTNLGKDLGANLQPFRR